MATKKTIRLSSNQKQVISSMREGKKLHWITGINARCFFEHMKRNVGWPTVFKLEKLGIIKRFDLNNKIELTELGKTIDL